MMVLTEVLFFVGRAAGLAGWEQVSHLVKGYRVVLRFRVLGFGLGIQVQL